jgi:hypothetical protein
MQDEMILEIQEDAHKVLRVWVKGAIGEEVYPSLATYWMERLGRKALCLTQEEEVSQE